MEQEQHHVNSSLIEQEQHHVNSWVGAMFSEDTCQIAGEKSLHCYTQ